MRRAPRAKRPRQFEKLGEHVAEVKADNLAGAAAARWLALSPEERTNTGLIAPSHTLREDMNAIVRERLVSKGYTNAEKGDELRVAGVAHAARTVRLEGGNGQSVAGGAPPRGGARGRGRGLSS